MYTALTAWPAVLPAAYKELHFFDLNHWRGERWYRQFFPSRYVRWRRAKAGAGQLVTGEASPYYLFHPAVPERVAHLLPDVRLIAVLRDPVQRAYSHFQHERAAGCEHLTFPEALAAEEHRLGGISDDYLATHSSFPHRHYSYAARGYYADQLERWLRWFPPTQILVLTSEALFRDPRASLASVADFLGVTPGAVEFPKRNRQDYESMPRDIQRTLSNRFAASNARVADLFGLDLEWS